MLFFEHSIITIQEGVFLTLHNTPSLMFSSIASIDFSPPAVVSASSDKHVRFLDMSTLQGWSTIPKDETPTANSHILPFSFPPSLGQTLTTNIASVCNFDSTHDKTASLVCQDCGSSRIENRISQLNRQAPMNCAHHDLVRTVALRQDFVLSGSYDSSIKVSRLFCFHAYSEPTGLSADLGSKDRCSRG